MESPGQSPFGLWVSHPGEWGLVETDLDAEIERNNREEQKIREEREKEDSTAARENTDTLRSCAIIRATVEEESVSVQSVEDENQPPVPERSSVQEVQDVQVPEVKVYNEPRENGETPAAIATNHADKRCVMCNKKVCSPSLSQHAQRANQPELSEVDFLLLMWLLLYCLFVLPHMDIRTISRFLLNLDE